MRPPCQCVFSNSLNTGGPGSLGTKADLVAPVDMARGPGPPSLGMQQAVGLFRETVACVDAACGPAGPGPEHSPARPSGLCPGPYSATAMTQLAGLRRGFGSPSPSRPGHLRRDPQGKGLFTHQAGVGVAWACGSSGKEVRPPAVPEPWGLPCQQPGHCTGLPLPKARTPPPGHGPALRGHARRGGRGGRDTEAVSQFDGLGREGSATTPTCIWWVWAGPPRGPR